MSVVAFRDHLCPDQDVEFAFVERVESSFEILMAAYGIAVEAANACLRKDSVQ